MGLGYDTFRTAMPTFEQSNPWIPAMQRMNQLRAQQLQNQVSQARSQYAAPQMAEQLEASRLQNQKTEAAIPYMNQQIESIIKQRQAQANLNNLHASNPLLYSSGTAGQLGAARYLQQQQQNSQPSDQFNYDNSIDQLNKTANRMSSGAGGKSWASLPADWKGQVLAQGAALGYTPEQVAQRMSQGQTLQQLAQESGHSQGLLGLQPKYAPTRSTVTQVQRRQGALSEINNLEPKMTEALAPYAQRFKGYSPKMIAEGLQGVNPDGQSSYLAARALAPEMAALRLKAMGGNISERAIEEIMNKSLQNVSAFEPMISPKVYKEMQDKLRTWVTDAAGRSNQKILGPVGSSFMRTAPTTQQNPIESYSKKSGIPVDLLHKMIQQKRG